MSLKTDRAEKYRRPHPIGLPHKKGDSFGWFEMKISPSGPWIRMQVSIEYEKFEFEHVSVSLAHRCPTWNEMCRVKDLFWDEEDTVVQYHPAKSEYVNYSPHCLHLWRWTRGEFPKPSTEEIGPK